ncbi:serine/threonine protein kinase [Streptomyces sp. NBC_00250]|uniref:serine/threonine-protein kinase n=1 Tax=Streptomyces sp. NBC_00250 TaxID=2903641 RepID=UPI002E2D7979|nr:serine/threonine-protein kinase [Streptomyces sp. NBC_00250]
MTRPLGPSDPRAAGPYRLLAELGRGGMGRVFLGAAPDGRLAAVKQVHARLAADEGFRARFRREVEASRKVSGACTAAVMDADTEAATPWLASVFVAGPSLGAAVERSGTLPVETVRRLAVQLATALEEIHRGGLIHRDLKPENVLLAEDGARVIDFGIARAAEAGAGAGAGHLTELTGTGLVVGSPAFMSPEQAEGKELTPASDVFSLGSVLALASTGASPFAGPSTFLALYNVVHTEPDLASVPPELRAVVTWCLAKDPAARPTPAQLLAALGAAAPVVRQWPPAVHAAIAEQQRGIDRLIAGGEVGDHERTVVLPPGGGAGPTAVATRMAVGVTEPAAAPPPRPRRTGRFVAAGVALAVLGAGAWWYQADGGLGSGPPDLYVTMPICSETAAELPVPGERRPDQDSYSDYSDRAETSCSWNDKDEPQSDGWNFYAHAMVRWDLRRSAGTDENGTRRQEQDFAEDAEGERPETGLAFADEAFWDGPSDAQTTCTLYVRKGNLVVFVSLGGERHPAETCEQEAKKIAEAAVAAMPSAS